MFHTESQFLKQVHVGYGPDALGVVLYILYIMVTIICRYIFCDFF